jgi:hypothetical protein
MLSKILFKDFPFHVFSTYIQIHATYSQYTNRFIPCILSIHTDSFCVFGECVQIISNIHDGIIFFTASKGHYVKKQYVCVQLKQRQTRYNWLLGSSSTIKFLSLHCYNMRNDLQIEISRQSQIFKIIKCSNQRSRSMLLKKKMEVENFVQVSFNPN